ncbi:MAG: aromatic amino acid hydroxylase [Pseudomonadales bacterium]|nr:aromatic amino acid hydroxylase [Pseudomonadales bacterium]
MSREIDLIPAALSQTDIRTQLPFHLRQFVAEQDYDKRYNARDQAIWRYVLSQLVNHLKDKAHPVYFNGLKRTGITLEKIPSIDEMNICLKQLGWRAIVVDGFIPPQAFMELQSLKVLAIAVDMRSIEHIDYTPAPDIIHEAAGHAPIIADEEYAEYLQRFGAIGMKAIFNQWDVAVYEAVRSLSIAKEDYDLTNYEIVKFEDNLNELLASPGEPSELALLTRLHWWTVEYGLVGNVDDSGIFGAGLLSSLGESRHCLSDSVLKLPLTVEAVLTSYDITQEQPQLFVTKSCRHLTQILEEYAATMCYQKGGSSSLASAMSCGVVTTTEYSSGLQVSGRLTRLMTNALGGEIYIGTEGPTQLSVACKELEGHDTTYHSAGFGSPVGRICNLMKPLEDASEYDLQIMNIKREQIVCLEFLSGVTVKGWLKGLTKEDGKIVLLSFENCTVLDPKGDSLFDPKWGAYDMAVGESIVSVFAGSADREKFDVFPPKPEEKKSVNRPAKELPNEIKFYLELRNFRNCLSNNEEVTREEFMELVQESQKSHPAEWLLHLELHELSLSMKMHNEITTLHLESLCKTHQEFKHLINQGLELIGLENA